MEVAIFIVSGVAIICCGVIITVATANLTAPGLAESAVLGTLPPFRLVGGLFLGFMTGVLTIITGIISLLYLSTH